MTFGQAFDAIRNNPKKYMRLPNWCKDIKVRVQNTDTNNKIAHPFFCVENIFGCVPWKESVEELFSEEWKVYED